MDELIYYSTTRKQYGGALKRIEENNIFMRSIASIIPFKDKLKY